jgi:hypothetical protein
MRLMKKTLLLSIVSIYLILGSCKEDNPFVVDVSDVKVDIKTKHFEKDLFKFNLDSSDYYVNYYKKTYGRFFEIFNYQIVEMGNPNDKNYALNLTEYLKFWKNEKIPQILAREFPDFDKEQLPAITEAFKHYKYYFPNNYIPEIYTYFSSFGYSVVTIDSIIGLGIDKYLGKKYNDLYSKAGWSDYQKRRMIKEMIPVDLMESVAKADYPYPEEGTDNLLSHMIYEGKVQYYLNCMLPETPDTLKWKYTGKQWDWANQYEKKVWNYIAEHQLLYTNDKIEIGKMTGEGPYTTVFRESSAPRAAVFIGYKIVLNYMNNNPKVSLKQLMEENDPSKLLAGAKYNP